MTVGPMRLGYMGKYRARHQIQDTLSQAQTSIDDPKDSETRRTVDVFAFRLMSDTFFILKTGGDNASDDMSGAQKSTLAE
ncbi:hypothetical protein IW262DRAFT_1467618 [Armillaria fumosa]|nr:hypothetical protein IW262DRAFT_1467618 [Armillaria fumosa]